MAGSPKAVPRISGSSTSRVVGFSDGVAGLPSVMGVLMVSVMSGPVPHSLCGSLLGYCPFKDSLIGEGGKMHHGPPQLMDTSHQKVWLVRLWWNGLFGPVLQGLGICQDLPGLSFPEILAGNPGIQYQQECLPTKAFWDGWQRIVIVDF